MIELDTKWRYTRRYVGNNSIKMLVSYLHLSMNEVYQKMIFKNSVLPNSLTNSGKQI
jgi:hypothetical protein